MAVICYSNFLPIDDMCNWMQFECNADKKIPIKTFLYENEQRLKALIISEKTKITSKPESLLVGADDGTWTHTVLLPLEPESSASANSATSAKYKPLTFTRWGNRGGALRLIRKLIKSYYSLLHEFVFVKKKQIKFLFCTAKIKICRQYFCLFDLLFYKDVIK